MDIFKWIVVFAASLFFLIKSADYFTNAAEKIGLHFKIPPFIIGVTIVALGTSLPEVATSILSVLGGHSEIVIGNVTGSNIANILLVLALAAIVGKHLVVDKEIINIDLPILLGSTILLFITTLDGEFAAIDGIISLIVLLTYVLYNIKTHRTVNPKEIKEQKVIKKAVKKEEKKADGLTFKYPAILLGSSILLYFSAKFTIDSVIAISSILNIAADVIAVSAIAIGTSLPEIAVSVVAAKKGKADIAIGNVTGSNIFNTLGVMGIPSLIGPLWISTEMLAFTIPALVFITILYVFVTMDKQISQWEGITLLLVYVAFMGKVFGVI